MTTIAITATVQYDGKAATHVGRELREAVRYALTHALVAGVNAQMVDVSDALVVTDVQPRRLRRGEKAKAQFRRRSA